MSDVELEITLFPPNTEDDSKQPEPDYVYIQQGLVKEFKGAAIDRILWEYKQTYTAGYEKS